MKKRFIIFWGYIFIIFLNVSCLKTIDEPEQGTVGKEIIIPDENFNTNTQNITVTFAVSITFSNGQTIVNNPFEEWGVKVSVDKQNVTITSTITDIEVNYVLAGKTSNGFVKIYSDYRFGLFFNGVSILNPTGAAINIQSGKRVSVMLVDKTANRLIDGGTFEMVEDERMNGTFYSEGQLIFDGNGSLTVYGNDGHAICVRDYIRIKRGNITVNNATSDGIHCRDYFEMNDGNVVINAQSDGVECTNGYITIEGGTMKTKSGNKGLKTAENLTITGGRIEIESLDDGIRAESNLVFTGGDIYCYSSKNGIVSTQGAVAISGGLVVASGVKNVFSCGDFFSITGGTAIGVGSATFLPTARECKQQTVVWGASGFTAGQAINIKSSGNTDVLVFKLPQTYSNNMALVYTSPLLQANTNYTIFKGGTVTGGSNFHGLYTGAVSNGGTSAASFTTSNMVTTVGNVVF